MRIIVVIAGGCMQDVYADCQNVEVELLDYDNLLAEEDGAELVAMQALEAEIKEKTASGALHRIW